jgi:hypothetical protein
VANRNKCQRNASRASLPAPSTLTDTALMGFWEVSDLRKLGTPIGLGELSGYETKAKVSGTPRHPMFVDDKAV